MVSTRTSILYGRTLVLRVLKWSGLPVLCACLLLADGAFGQVRPAYWQQSVAYDIEVRLDDENHLLLGTETVRYHNHSPDTLSRVFFHLYYNAFRPGSMMDVRSRAISDPDRRVQDRIYHLKPGEQGWQRVRSIKQDGVAVRFSVEDTVLTVWLHTPLPPGESTTFFLDFTTQVPVHIRRAGRDNKEDIAYSMAQWYPKIAEYDASGWHAHPYIGREFYGVWGSFDVKITLPAPYVVAGTGVLQNAKQIGEGYARRSKKNKNSVRTWHFVAEDVHDFVWAADPNYLHDTVRLPSGVTVRFFYTPTHRKNWKRLQKDMETIFPLAERHFGKYPYTTYSIIQGGDGGMEYPMATLVTANRTYKSLLGVVVHELMHSWYQGVLGSNESLYAWLDEGFTSYAEAFVLHFFSAPEASVFDPPPYTYKAYRAITAGGEERMNTWADHFTTNRAYGIASYVKGEIFQHQLGYVVGREALARALLVYYDRWKFKHPAPTDYMRIVEEVSGLELDWYYEYFANTIHTIDYGVEGLRSETRGTRVLLRRKGVMPMPLDIRVRYKDGTEERYTIPLSIMNGHKKEGDAVPLQPWFWTDPSYDFLLPVYPDQIQEVTIDPTGRLADVDLSDQSYPKRSPSDE